MEIGEAKFRVSLKHPKQFKEPHMYRKSPAVASNSSDNGVPATWIRKIDWPDANDRGRPRKCSIDNIYHFLEEQGWRIRLNTFTDIIEVSGLGRQGTFDDATLNTIWAQVCMLGLSDTVDTLQRLLTVIARRNRYHPVLEYLRKLDWDGRPRLDTWLTTYAGAEDNELNSAFGAITLLGAVHRVAQPGYKHDTMLVLEGQQGIGKSSIAATLGGAWFGDGLQLGLGARETIEQTRGRWIVETPELSGMSNREIEHVKAQLTRQVDQARMAYARLAVSVPRQFILIGTTNDDRYLKDPTGNRRFLPVRVGTIDIKALRRDRDQLWAEAYSRAYVGDEPSQLPEELWGEAAEVQERRRVVSPVEELLVDALADVHGILPKEAIWEALGDKLAAKRDQRTSNAIAATMKRLGWAASRQRRPNGKPEQVYIKRVQGLPAEWLFCSGSGFSSAAQSDILGISGIDVQG